MKFLVLFLLSISFAFAQLGVDYTLEAPKHSSYDPGVSKIERELIDLMAECPYMPGLSEEIMRHTQKYGKMRTVQKFREAFGPTFWRMLTTENAIKILAEGQDATHVAETAGRTATAGFGGRIQDLMKHFGVDYSGGFFNVYAYTIYGQYSSRGKPYLHQGKFKTDKTITPNDTWLLTQDPMSPIAQWRNRFIDFVIRHNKDSLKMIMLFGGAAKDSFGAYLESRGAKVGTSHSRIVKNIQVPETFNVGSGGNGEFPVLYTKEGKDAYSQIVGRKLNYSNPKDQAVVQDILKNKRKELEAIAVFSKAGKDGNGLIHPAQFGGYNLDSVYIGGKKTRNLKGIVLEDGTKVTWDILWTGAPHPTYLSNTMNEAAMKEWKRLLEKENVKAYKQMKLKYQSSNRRVDLSFYKDVFAAMNDKALAKEISRKGYKIGGDAAADLVARDFNKLKPYTEKGIGVIEPDIGPDGKLMTNHFKLGREYSYGRSDINIVFYDYGTPRSRMVSKSYGRRGSHRMKVGNRKVSMNARILIFGGRDVPKYNMKAMDRMLQAKPAAFPPSDEIWIGPYRGEKTRYLYNQGPGAKYGEILKRIDYKAIETPMSGKSGIEAFHTASHPLTHGDFGHFRGLIDNPRAIILADPDGFDDLITSVALSGSRGQYLQGLMDDVGIFDDYVVIKTVPYSMDGKSEASWNKMLSYTKEARETAIRELITDFNPELIISDGQYAGKEMKRILGNDAHSIAKHVHIQKQGLANNSGIKKAGYAMNKILGRSGSISADMANIPITHMYQWARTWMGTSGDRVLNSYGADKGIVFQEVQPTWALDQKVELNAYEKAQVEKIRARLIQEGFPLPEERIKDYVNRVNICNENFKLGA
jgi:hypothetical protein